MVANDRIFHDFDLSTVRADTLELEVQCTPRSSSIVRFGLRMILSEVRIHPQLNFNLD